MPILKGLGAALVTVVVFVLLIAVVNKPLDSISLAVMALVVVGVGFVIYRQARRSRISGHAEN